MSTATAHGPAVEVYDLFVSYAHADDEVPIGAQTGWVTTLVAELKKVLRRKLGGAGAVEWMDHRLASHEAVTTTLLDRLGRSRVLLLVMSPGYVQSRWCRDELANFAAKARIEGRADAIFPIEVEGVPRADWPDAIQALSPTSFVETSALGGTRRLAGYPVPKPDEDSLYWRTLTELADRLAERLAGLRAKAPAVGRPVGVVLADPADDADDRHAEVKSALRQRPDVVLLPASPYPHTLAVDFVARVRHDLSQAALFVQVLSLSPGARLPGGDQRIVALQHHLAAGHAAAVEASGQAFSRMRWLAADRDPAHAPDATLADLLKDATISRDGFEAFRQSVMLRLDELTGKARTTATTTVAPALAPLYLPRPRSGAIGPTGTPTAPPSAAAAAVVAGAGLSLFVHATPEDQDQAAQVADSLVRHGIDIQLSPAPSNGQSYLQCLDDYADAIRGCDAMLMVHGRCPPSAVSVAFQFGRRHFGMRRTGVWAAVLSLPPHDKPPITVRSANLVTVDCRDGFDPGRLQPFLAHLRSAQPGVAGV